MNTTPTTYAIRVDGHLDDHWSPWLGAVRMTHDEDGTTTITASIADQAQLHGVLAGLRDIGAVITELRAASTTASSHNRYVAVMAMGEKPDVLVPSDQAPSYQLEIEDIVVGDGDEALSGKVVEVHYVGVSWKTGQQFDASWDRGSTFKFGLGKGQVIAGWDQGVAGMRVGGRRRITIPPMLAYGKRGAGRAIGPDETLVFVVDLISVR